MDQRFLPWQPWSTSAGLRRFVRLHGRVGVVISSKLCVLHRRVYLRGGFLWGDTTTALTKLRPSLDGTTFGGITRVRRPPWGKVQRILHVALRGTHVRRCICILCASIRLQEEWPGSEHLINGHL
jgi:hypothetical protein